MRYLLIISISLLSFFNIKAQSQREHVSAGNEQYQKEQYSEAEASYLKALEKDPYMQEGIFNLGDALYQGERYESAAQQFQSSSQSLTRPLQKAAAYHNLGNSLLKAEKLEESIEAYKEALRHFPQDVDTKYNLSYAQRLLKKQEQEQEQEQEEDKKEEEKEKKEEKEDSEDQEKKEQEEEQEKPEDQKEKDKSRDKDPDDLEREQKEKQQGEQTKQPDENKPKPEPRGLSTQEAERLLKALLNEEKKVQEKLQKQKIKSSSTRLEKDW